MNFDFVRDFLNDSDILKGIKYDKKKVVLLEKGLKKGKNYLLFNVKSERTAGKYSCLITMDGEKIEDMHCTCPQYYDTESCKHLAACVVKNVELFKNSSYTDENKTKKLFALFNKSSNADKKNVQLKIQISSYDSYRNREFFIRALVGVDKLYSLSSKINKFVYDVHCDREIRLGAKFTYNKDEFYFNDDDKRILEFLYKNGQSFATELVISEDKLFDFLKLLKNKEFTYNGILIKNHVNSMPLSFNMKKVENKYDIEILKDCDFEVVTGDLKIYTGNNTFYYLNDKEVLLFEELADNKINKIEFKAEDLGEFGKSLYKVIENKITIKDDETKNKLVIITPSIKLYFDINGLGIIGRIMFTYKDDEINYFDNTDFIRNTDVEDAVVQDLNKLGFINSDKSFKLNDEESEVNFLENGLEYLSSKYNVFTSEKFDNVSVISNERITSNFSIGQDNILNYDFDLGRIDANEIDKVMSSLREKKKYYRLKNGSLLDLDKQNELIKLDEFVTNNDISFKDIKDGGVMPKYRALYLDSVKKKYSFIKTDNLFKKFINNFKSGIKENIELTKVEKDLLRDYQEVGVSWLYKIDKLGFGGILADEMGLGKTLQVIIYIRHLLMENKDAKILIVVPTSLAYNWEREIEKFAKELSYNVILGNKSIRMKKLNDNKASIIITTYGLLREDIDIYKKLSFRVMFIDEAQNIKNPGAKLTKAVKDVKADTKFALTGTPLENSVIELWSIFDYIMPGLLSNYAKFSSRYKNINMQDNNTIKLLDNLNKLIEPFILRRRKKDVVKDLPDKIENTIYLDLSEEQKIVYLDELDKAKSQIDSIIKNGSFNNNKIMILKLLTRLREVCISPKILYDNYKGGSKIDSLIDILNSFILNGHKVLLFSSFKTSLDLVSLELDKNNISYFRMDGSVPSKTRLELVDKFNADNTNVFMITLKSGGTGLNLVGADVVIHLDLWWNPQVEAQATDRAHRIGQKRNVEVVKIICKGTIEEKILDLQEKKKALSDKLIENANEDIVISKLSEKDIKNLLSYENE